MEVRMGLFDNLGGSLGGLFQQAAGGGMSEVISGALAKTNFGGLQGLVDQLQQGGLGDQVKSWLGNGTNMPVTQEQLEAALGSDQVRQLAEKFGVPVDGVLEFLSRHLPAAVDQASPGGTLQS
jgi:uncharacterized protein YidB (DUF937 family)